MKHCYLIIIWTSLTRSFYIVYSLLDPVFIMCN